MKINENIINEYQDYLSSTRDYIIGDIQTSASQLAKKIARNISMYLEDRMHYDKWSIILPSEADLKDKIVETIKDYYFDNIKNIDTFVINQNSSIDACVTNMENELEMNIDMFVNNLESNCELMGQRENVPAPIGKIIDQLITHINFRNRDNQEYNQHENAIEAFVRERTQPLVKKDSTEFEDKRYNYEGKLAKKSYEFVDYLKVNAISNLTEEQKNELVYGREMNPELTKAFR